MDPSAIVGARAEIRRVVDDLHPHQHCIGLHGSDAPGLSWCTQGAVHFVRPCGLRASGDGIGVAGAALRVGVDIALSDYESIATTKSPNQGEISACSRCHFRDGADVDYG